jgi:hypothetical protein
LKINVLALQGGIADGSEPTFDGQPMQKGVHLRWSFLPALGFPPGGFWLCRREAQPGEKQIPPPPGASQLASSSGGDCGGVTATGAPAGTTSGNTWETTLPKPCESVTLAGCAAPGCDEVVIETFSCDDAGGLTISERRTVRVEEGAFRIRVQARSIACVRVVGAGSVDECGCGEVPPPDNCGCGQTGGCGSGPPCQGDPCWGQPNNNGWQCWGVPFTLPVTVEQWPARYFGAPDPAITAAATVLLDDIREAKRRLGSLQLEASLSAADEKKALIELRAELVRLVQGFPSMLLNQVPLAPPDAGANAPRLNINVMQQLLLLALDPYFARVLGLYFVDEFAQPGTQYDYSITGYWGSTNCDNTVVFPGLAPGSSLARGMATFGGITIEPAGGNTSLWRWTKYDVNGNYTPRVDPLAPQLAQNAANAIAGALSEAQQPDALLLAFSPGSWFVPPTPRPQVTISLTQPMLRVDAQVAGNGVVQGLSQGVVVSTSAFNSPQLSTVTVTAAGADQPIDQIQINEAQFSSILGYVVAVGALTLHPLSPDGIGTLYAVMPPPVAIQPVDAPGQPYTTFRHRQADIDPKALTLVRHSLFDVEWPAPPLTAAQQTGDPVTDPIDLPPPTVAIGFVAQRRDSGAANSTKALDGWTTTRSAPKTTGSKVPTDNLYRRVDSELPDPAGGWQHRVAGFDLFGVRGAWSSWSDPRGVERIAAPPSAMRILEFDNSAAGGGAASADGSKWSGGTLDLLLNWAGAAYMMYPDIVTARIRVDSIDNTGASTGTLATHDLHVPGPKIKKLTVASLIPTPASDGLSYTVEVQTTPALTLGASTDPAQVLMLTLSDGSSERYAIRPTVSASAAPGATTPVVASLTAGNAARIITAGPQFVGQPAYLVSGWGTTLEMSVPLVVPVDQQTAQGQVSVTGSSKNPFDPSEQIIDPNGVNAPRPEPQSPALRFTGAQWLVPPAPPTPQQVIVAHQVNHLFYDPADANGNASKTLPFTTAGGTGISGYVLQREPVRSLSLVDVKRRIGAGNLSDNNPVVLDGGNPRADLAAWIASLDRWLAAYNAVGAYNAAHGGPAFTALTAANALQDAGGQRSFIEHFHGGLLDDELCALANVTGNSAGYVRVNPQPLPPGTTTNDTVDGSGYGRTVYRLAAVNQAGSFSATTGSIGPYYTTVVAPPRPPVLYKLQPTESAIIVAWALDTNPDVAAYEVYRAPDVNDLGDLRYWGPDVSHPSANNLLPTTQYNTQSYPPLTFVQGSGLNIDQRIVGFVPDPRLCARDYNGSDMGEVVLPPGPPPDVVNGVYRLSDYITALGPAGQVAFNYWTPPAAGGIAQVVTSSHTQSRLTGLRIGLGRGVPVVVVATWGGKAAALGVVPVRRAGFIDGADAGGHPLDPNAIAGSQPNAAAFNAYAVVAVDIFGNRSAPSSVFAAQMLSPIAAG